MDITMLRTIKSRIHSKNWRELCHHTATSKLRLNVAPMFQFKVYHESFQEGSLELDSQVCQQPIVVAASPSAEEAPHSILYDA